MAKPLFDAQSTQTAKLADLIDVVKGGIVTKHLLDTGEFKQVLFGLDAEQELTEHRSPYLATIHVLDGKIHVGVDDTEHDLSAGDWLLMPPNARHRLHTAVACRFLLTLVKR